MLKEMLVYVVAGYLLGREETITTLYEVFRVLGACIQYVKSRCQPKPTKRSIPSLSETLESAKPLHWPSHNVCEDEDECDCEDEDELPAAGSAEIPAAVSAEIPALGATEATLASDAAPIAATEDATAVTHEELKKDI